jgi:Variant SH3 domain
MLYFCLFLSRSSLLIVLPVDSDDALLIIEIKTFLDKSLGDTSDIISDSSGVGTNSDSAACSIGHPSTTVVCMELYTSNVAGHLNIQPGDVIEVVGSTDCGLLEGYVRGTNRTGFFPIECVQEVHFRQKNITNVSTANSAGQYRETMQQQTVQQDLQMGQQEQQMPQQKLQQHYQSQQQQPHGQYSSSTAPRVKKM